MAVLHTHHPFASAKDCVSLQEPLGSWQAGWRDSHLYLQLRPRGLPGHIQNCSYDKWISHLPMKSQPRGNVIEDLFLLWGVFEESFKEAQEELLSWEMSPPTSRLHRLIRPSPTQAKLVLGSGVSLWIIGKGPSPDPRVKRKDGEEPLHLSPCPVSTRLGLQKLLDATKQGKRRTSRSY